VYEFSASDSDYVCPGEIKDSKILDLSSYAGKDSLVLGPQHLLFSFITLASLLVALF
jgi:hypothetical protein